MNFIIVVIKILSEYDFDYTLAILISQGFTEWS